MLDWLIPLLLGLAIFLAFVTVVGHGIWVLLAKLLGRGKRHEDDNGVPRPRCPRCLNWLEEPAQCRMCGWRAVSEKPRPETTQVARHQIDGLLKQGWITSEVHRQVVEAMAAQQAARRAKAPPVKPAAAPPSQPSPAIPLSPPAKPADDFVQAELVIPAPESTAPATPESVRPASPPPRVPKSVEDRADRYQQRRAEAAAKAATRPAQPSVPSAPPPPPPQLRSSWLAAFMEEKHIRWGELVGGLMIVSSSIALVVSFWSAIAERPILKFGVLNGVTAALFGVGLYAARRWKLPTTSQGILLTSTLLVPLNFLAIAAFSQDGELLTLPVLVGEGLSTILLGTLVFLAARIITPVWPATVTAGVLLPAVGQLILRRHVDETSTIGSLYGFALAGVAVYLASQVPVLWSHRGREPLGEKQGNEVIKQLGLITFSLGVAFGLLLVKAQDPAERLQWLSPLSILLVAPAMGCGLLLWKRPGVVEQGLRITGTAIAVVAAVVAVAGVALAWPQPVLLFGCCMLSFLGLTLLAWWYEIDEAHLLAAALASASAVMLLMWMSGTVGWTVDSSSQLVSALLSASAGRALTAVAFLQLGVAGWLASRSKRLPALNYGSVGAVTAGLGLVLVTWFGWGRAGDPEYLTWLLGFYGIVACVVAFGGRQAWAQSLAGLLLLAALAQGVVYGPWQIDLPRWTLWLTALLLHASLMSLLASGVKLLRAEARDAVLEPSVAWSLISTIAAVGLIVGTVALEWGPASAGHIAWIALIWLNLAWVVSSSPLFTLFQAALVMALMVAVDHRLETKPWYTSMDRGWLNPISLQWQGIVLAGYGLAWSCLRLASARRLAVGVSQGAPVCQWLSRAFCPAWPRVDRLAVVLAVVLLSLLTLYAVVPGITQELSPISGETRTVPPLDEFQVLGLPYAPAGGLLTWVLCGVVMFAFLVGLREQSEIGGLTGLTVAASTIPLLLATLWESQVAVASATRWTSAMFFLVGSLLVWWRRPLARLLRTWGIAQPGSSRMAGPSFALLLFLATAPVLAMAIFVALAALSLTPPTGAQLDLLWWLAWVAVIPLLIVLAGRWYAPNRPDGWSAAAGSLMILAIMPLFAMTAFVVGQALSAHPVVGPEANSFFARIGLSASYAVPLIILSFALIGHAISFRSEPLAFAAGLLLSFSLTAAYLLGQRVSGALTTEQWVRLAQLNSIIAATYGICWQGFLWTRRSVHRPAQLADGWRRTQLGIAAGFLLLPVLAMVAAMFASPVTSQAVNVAAGIWGWTALALVALHVAVYHQLQERLVPSTLLLALFYVLLALAALQSQALQLGMPKANWLTYHLLQIAAAVAGLAVVAVELWERRWPAVQRAQSNNALRSAVGLLPLAALVLLSLRSVPMDPRAHWWSVLGLAAAVGLSIDRGWRWERQRYLWFAALLLNLASSIWFVDFGYRLIGTGDGVVLDFINWNVVAMAVPVPLWVMLRQREPAKRMGLPGLHSVAIAMALLLLGLAVGLGLVADAAGAQIVAWPWMTALALVATAVASISCLWDSRSHWSTAFCYLTGLAATAALLDLLNADATAVTWLSTLLLSAFGVATSYLWSRREGLRAATQQLGVPARRDDRLPSRYWLVPLNGCLALVVCALGVWVQFSCEHAGLRLAASQAVAAQALAMGLLARGRGETGLRYFALLIGVVAAVCFGWSWLSPIAAQNQWLNRWVVLTAALLGMAVFYGFGLVKLVRRENAWTTAARRLVPGLVLAGALAVVVVLGSEVYLFAQDGVAHLAWPGIVAVGAALLATAVACLLAAIVPGRDPLGLSDKQRTLYVYATEVLVALFCLHLRVTVPELFTGLVQRYWTILVMGLAFLGVGLSEWFRRRQQMVLAEPLERTGVLLPLLPVLAYWVTPQELQPNVHYSLVLLMVGGLYAALSILRRSFGFGLLAVLAANGGLWYFLQKTAEISFLEHPQLWLVPLAACVLVAAYLNRDQLTSAQMTSIRYMSSSVIYTASTADIFIQGVAEAPWLPMILAGLSIAGIFAGILLRVRAFLFLGLSFLVVSMLTVIWHAAVDLQQTWLWYVVGIIVGTLIIAVFAVFERKRQEVLQLMDQLKTWDA